MNKYVIDQSDCVHGNYRVNIIYSSCDLRRFWQSYLVCYKHLHFPILISPIPTFQDVRWQQVSSEIMRTAGYLFCLPPHVAISFSRSIMVYKHINLHIKPNQLQNYECMKYEQSIYIWSLSSYQRYQYVINNSTNYTNSAYVSVVCQLENFYKVSWKSYLYGFVIYQEYDIAWEISLSWGNIFWSYRIDTHHYKQFYLICFFIQAKYYPWITKNTFLTFHWL